MPKTPNVMQDMGSLLDLLKPDWSKADKPKIISGAGLIVDGLKGTTTWPGDFDDALWDMLKNAVITYFNQKADGGDVHVTVGDTAHDTTDVDAYLNHLGVGTGPNMEEVRQKLRSRPNTLNTLKKNFTEDEQRKIVGNPFIIGLLTIFGPLVIDLIKRWLSK